MRAAPLTAAALAALVAVSGCSGSKTSPAEDDEGEAQQMSSEASTSSTTETSESTEEAAGSEDLPTDEDLLAFVEAIASGDVSAVEDVRSLAVEGSVADAYLTYQAHSAQAFVDAGMANMTSQTVDPVEDGFELCLDAEPDNCSTFADFVGSEGKVQSFTVDGRSLDDRIVVGDGSPVVGDQGAEVSPIIAYRAASSDTLFIGFDLAAGEKPIMYTMATYRGPDGRESESSSFFGSTDLSADSMASQLVAFPGAALGGELTLEVGYDNTTRPVEITIPITAE